MVITTSHTVDGRTISEYLGVVAAVDMCIMIAGPKDMTMGYQKGVDAVLARLSESAESRGADAIISVKISLAKREIYAYGTAVKLS